MHASHSDAKDGDADNDGLPDTWEFRNLLSHSFTASDDPDADGKDNLAELTAKTDPLVAD